MKSESGFSFAIASQPFVTKGDNFADAFTSGAEIRKIKVPVETPEWHTASEILKLQMK